MELLQLRYFHDSAHFQSFAKTAAKYMVPSSGVSAAIKRLEKELGCLLFRRYSNRIELTPEGKRLRDTLDLVLGELDQTVHSILFPEDDTKIRLLVGSIRHKISDLIIEYHQRHPQVRFETVFHSGKLPAEDFDVIIDTEKEVYRDWERILISEHDLAFRASATSDLVGKDLTVKDLAGEYFVTMGEESALHHTLVEICEEAGFTPNIIMQMNDAQCFQKFIRSGIAIALCRRSYANLAPEGNQYLRVSDLKRTQRIYLYYRSGDQSKNVKSFIEFLKLSHL